jgi:hypothetical protein
MLKNEYQIEESRRDSEIRMTIFLIKSPIDNIFLMRYGPNFVSSGPTIIR